MKTLIYGAGPIGRWLALRLHLAGQDVTLLMVFSKLFGSRSGEIRFGLHVRSVGPELLEMAEEFAELKARARLETPDLDALLDDVPRPQRAADRTAVAS